MSKKKRLGRGLEALLGVGGQKDSTAENQSGENQSKDEIDPGRISLENGGPVTNSTEDTSTASSKPTAEDADEPKILPFKRERKEPRTPRGPIDSSRPATVAMQPAEKPETAPPPQGEVGAKDVRAKDLPDKMPPATTRKKTARQPADVMELNVYDVDDNPFQPRREFNKSEIESLAESLKTHAQLQPILVRKTGDRYQLISGERRLRAAVHAGWSKIRAQVREADDRLVAELAIVENLQRKDLNPIEKALSFRRYLDEHSCSQEDLAGRLKIDRSTVTNLLRLLELPSAVQKALQVGLISNGHARALLPLGEEHLQIEFCNRIQREGLSVRAIEQMVREKIEQMDSVGGKSSSRARTKSGQILSLEKELQIALGTRVEIKPSSKSKGKITVHYSSLEEFERLRQFFGDSEDKSNKGAA